jgi:hypothetical protein
MVEAKQQSDSKKKAKNALPKAEELINTAKKSAVKDYATHAGLNMDQLRKIVKEKRRKDRGGKDAPKPG